MSQVRVDFTVSKRSIQDLSVREKVSCVRTYVHFFTYIHKLRVNITQLAICFDMHITDRCLNLLLEKIMWDPTKKMHAYDAL
jgi:hypothetical protein